MRSGGRRSTKALADQLRQAFRIHNAAAGQASGVMSKIRQGKMDGDMGFTISDLRERPEFFPVVADRVWDFTWKAKGLSLEQVSVDLRELISNQAFPFVIVAHDGERYVRSTLGIISDLDECPEYTPWVAAVWVEPENRGQNVGRSLVSHAAERLLQTFQRVYLGARPARHDFYARQGWVPIEYEVGEKRLTVFVKE